jgi:cell shape-determining protein MreD
LAILTAFPLFIILVIIQAGILSRINLLQGSADVILLVILSWSLQDRVKTSWHWALIGGALANLATFLPFGTLPVIYSLVTALGSALRRWIWKAPILAMLVGTVLGTIILYAASFFMITIRGTLVSWIDTVNLVVLPGILLNLLFAFPVYYLVRDLANWLYPEELET